MAKKDKRFNIEMKAAKAGDSDPEIAKVQKYLTRFGHLTTTCVMGKLDKPTSEAVKSFQLSQGLDVSGDLTAKTIEAMEAARCGVPDVELVQALSGDVGAEFVLRGCKYNKRAFTHRFLNGTGDIAGTAERDAVQRAFDTWASVLCGVSFRRVTSGASDFQVGWFAGNHGDGSAFDGVGNTLAHAFFPPPCGGANAGACHFDEAESWSLTGAGATFDLETVALHEIGHLLGLSHSSVPGSVMFPSYGGVRRNLTQDDIDGIRRLYPFFCRRGDSGSQAGFVSEIAAARHNTRQVVTAVRTQARTLKLIAWRVNVNGSIVRTGDSGEQAGAASSISIARQPTGSRFVTAVRTSSGDLKLISWDVNNAGSAITRRGDSGNQAGRASLINICALTNSRFATAVRTAEGRLRVILWGLENTGALTRLSDSGNAAGEVNDISIVRVANDRAVTPVRTAGGDLKLITWRLASNAVTRLGDSGNQAGDARNIRAVMGPSNHVVTAVRTSAGDLKLITWRVQAGGSVQRRGDSGSLAGEAGELDISMSGDLVITAVRTGSGNLKVIAWSVNGAGAVSREGDSDELAGTASLITLNEALSGAPPVVTSVRTANSSLKLISWSNV
jgi:hypothetical protein